MSKISEGSFNNSTVLSDDEMYGIERMHSSADLRDVTIICLTLIISGCFICNSCAILFIRGEQRSELSLKAKIVTLLCMSNIIQIIAYLIELHAAINSKIESVACQVSAFMICMPTYTSIGYFVALTVERYLAINKPYKYVAWFSDGSNTWWLGGPPIFGFLLALFPVLGWSKYGKSRDSATYCCISFDPTFEAGSYFIVAVFLVFVVPFAVITVCFARILSEVHRVVKDMKCRYGRRSTLGDEGRTIIKEQWLACLMTGVVYIGSWVPYAWVCCCFFLLGDVSEVTESISIFLCKSSTISSPIIYCLIERRFRLYVRERINSRLQILIKKHMKEIPMSV